MKLSTRAASAVALALVAAVAAVAVRTDTPAAAAGAAGAAEAMEAMEAADGRYAAEIRRTEYGIPHISAKDHGGLGFGYGYAFAQDNLCVLASWVVTLRGERSRHFGAESMSDDPVDPVPNLTSDVYHKSVADSGVVRRLLARPAPVGPSDELRRLVDGYAAGYNRYLAETGVSNLPDPTCRGKEWVGPITANDVWHTVLDLNRMAGGAALKEAVVGEAESDGPTRSAPGRTPPAPPTNNEPPFGAAGEPPFATAGESPFDATTGNLFGPVEGAPGSNGWALGKEATRAGTGMLLADPHFPWRGIRRFYQVHLTIPGVLDVAGGSLYGTPVVQIGHNASVAWTHTVSHAQRFALYRLTLVPGDPTSYLVDGRPEPMGRQEVEVTLRGGGIANHTLLTSRYGPVLAAGRSAETAYALADVNAANLRSADAWLAMAGAGNLAELRAAQDTYQGMPFVYTLAVDAGGTASFADASVVPHITAAQARRCAKPAPMPGLEATVLDGSTSACLLGKDRDAVVPGIFGPGNQPRLTRTDYVANSNNGYWLANPSAPLTGFPPVWDGGRAELDTRPRVSLDMIARRLAGSDGLGAPGFTLETLAATVQAKRNHSVELMRADLAALCRAHRELTTSDGRRVNVRRACATLAAWDGRATLDSEGAVLWREFFDRLGVPSKPGEPAPSWWRVPFDPERPLTTPRGLKHDDPATQRALADTVAFFQANRIPLTLTTGQAQRYAGIPIPGCTGSEGCFDRVRTGGPLGPDGRYPDVDTGSSFMMAVELTPDGPRSRTLLTYSLSANPSSPHHTDQTVLFSRGQWVTERFTDAEIAASPQLRTTTVRG
ncbi:peptidase S45 [Nonomuraea sp. NN258]|uniref:penicillin acylase family protein n=1 Tax=Nonomuraea antri TaxID=2730852 RepID=UPI0015691DF0|nr:penicillin acylase family protein [Nonomuraea antri]NRQ34729.1 peptidase S45 [Nonomuraea antri]